MNFTTALNEYPALKKLYFCEYNEELLETQMHLAGANKQELVERIKRNKAMIGNKRKGPLVLKKRQFIGHSSFSTLVCQLFYSSLPIFRDDVECENPAKSVLAPLRL